MTDVLYNTNRRQTEPGTVFYYFYIDIITSHKSNFCFSFYFVTYFLWFIFSLLYSVILYHCYLKAVIFLLPIKDPTDHTDRQCTRMKILYTDSCDHAPVRRITSCPGKSRVYFPCSFYSGLQLCRKELCSTVSVSLLRLHKEEFVSCSGFSILSMRYPIPMCVWIYCTPFFSGSSFFRSVAIKTLREATSFSEQRPQIC